MMQHDEARELLEAYRDDALDASVRADVHAHAAQCSLCTPALAHIDERRRLLQSPEMRYRAPASLRSQLKGRLAPQRAVRWWEGRLPVAWGAGLMMACVTLFVGSVALYVVRPAPNSLLADEAVSAHVRALITTSLVMIPSSDRHVVKPWFAGKIDFSPAVRDFAGDGFRLLGGRVDYLDHRPVAAIVYQHDAHLISVFVAPANDESAEQTPQRRSIRGYQTLYWTEGSLRYWAVSDVEMAQLSRLESLLTASVADAEAVDH